jgi:hypothetical protein
MDLTGWEQVGILPVDSGQMMFVDPCYVLPDERDFKGGGLEKSGAPEFSKDQCPLGYTELIDCWDYDSNQRVLKIPTRISGNSFYPGIVTSTGYGDGVYPIYIKKNGEGRVVGVFVDFDPQDDDYDEDATDWDADE